MACEWQACMLLSSLHPAIGATSILGFLPQLFMSGRHDLQSLASIYRLLLGLHCCPVPAAFGIMLMAQVCF